MLQKQNLADHSQVHPAMFMPSHGEFLVELLAREGFKTGMSFGLDDFEYHAGALNHTSSEILIVCGADQHFSEAFSKGWAKVARPYAYKVLIVSEPIFSPLAFYLGPNQNAAVNHEKFIDAFSPDCVLYLSRYDLIESQKRYGTAFARLLYSLADPELFREPVLGFEHKEKGLLYLGKPDAWIHSRAPRGHMTRQQQFDWFFGQKRLPFGSSFNSFSFRECYKVVNQFRYQLQPRSGFAFHSARTIQSALLGSLPVILLHPDELTILQAEAPYAEPDGNLILAYEGEFDILLDKLLDDDYARRVQARVGELLAGGTISQGVGLLAHLLRNFTQAATF